MSTTTLTADGAPVIELVSPLVAGSHTRATSGTGAVCARDLGTGWKVSPSVDVEAGTTFALATMDGPGVITHLWITVHPEHWRSLVLRAYWDGAEEPAVEVPYGDFFRISLKYAFQSQ